MSLRVPALLTGLSLLSLPLCGCFANVEHFADKAAKHSCKRLRECRKADFEERYDGDLARCRDDQYTDFLDFHDNVLEELHCEYIPDEARECVSVMRAVNKDCSEAADDDISDACDRVYDCPGLLESADPASPSDLADPGAPADAEDASTAPERADALGEPEGGAADLVEVIDPFDALTTPAP
ncbi:MAG: hypothetical protein KDK70_39900 [Myxococcales bacterium]|nr:hypothetical protein [Myxococcales bacterium]